MFVSIKTRIVELCVWVDDFYVYHIYYIAHNPSSTIYYSLRVAIVLGGEPRPRREPYVEGTEPARLFWRKVVNRHP